MVQVNECIRRYLEMGQRSLQKEAACVVSMIAAGSKRHKQIVFQGGTIPSLLHLLATTAFDVRKEVAYALGNVCVMRYENDYVDPIVEHLTILVDRGCILGFLALVKSLGHMEAARLGLHFLELIHHLVGKALLKSSQLNELKGGAIFGFDSEPVMLL